MAHFNREKVPERQPHARGAGVRGLREMTEDVSADGVQGDGAAQGSRSW